MTVRKLALRASESVRALLGDRNGAFVAFARRLAADAGVRVESHHPADGFVLLALGGDGFGYFPTFGRRPDGRARLSLLSRANWPGRVPAAAHVLMERLDQGSRTTVFDVTDVGPCNRCRATADFPDAFHVTPAGLRAALCGLAEGVRTADRALVEYGYFTPARR